MRDLLWKAHRWIGLACFLPFLVLTLTGLVLLLIPAWPDAGSSAIIPTGIDRAIAEAQSRFPGTKPGLILPGPAPDTAWTLMVSERGRPARTVRFDPQSGSISEITNSGSSLRDWALAMHNSLLMGLPGKLVMLTTALGIILMVVSGFSIMRQRLRVLSRAPWHGKAPIASLHKWSGLIALAFLFLLAVTGFMLLAFKTLGDARPPRPHPTATQAQPAPFKHMNITAISRKALRLRPGTEIQGIMPGDGQGPISVMLLNRAAPPWEKSQTVMFNGQTTDPLPTRPVPTFMQVMIAAKSLHTGLWDGRIIRAIYLGGGALCLLLGISGPVLWMQRRNLRNRNRPFRTLR